jgi:hypothetical protein
MIIELPTGSIDVFIFVNVETCFLISKNVLGGARE